MRKHILLFINGRRHTVRGGDALLTLSQFLRKRLRMCGTKIVCSEGDCGSCSVMCGEVDWGADDSTSSASQKSASHHPATTLRYRPIDSCIRFVFQLDGCHIVTVEGLNGGVAPEEKLTGVQKAMVDCHGSQCGFCTPGFVVAMTGVLEANEQPTEEDWRCGLTGNLCRCTGYSPIVAAGLASNTENTPALNTLFPAEEMLKEFDACRSDEIMLEAAAEIDGGFVAAQDPEQAAKIVYSPTTIDQATAFLNRHPDAKIVAGATDVGVQFNKGVKHANVWLDLNRIESLTGLTVNDNEIAAGARATWTDFEQAIKSVVPEFYKIVAVFGSPQIRHVGTIGGNVINASPIADSLPFLYVCNAQLELTSQSQTRSVDINDFYLGYKKFDLQPGELLTAIRIPLPSATTAFRLYKVSRRHDMDISTFTAAIAMDFDGDTIKTASLAYGAVGPTVLRLPKTESFLVGREFSLETMRLAGDVAVEEITPLGDVRGGADYRNQLARSVLQKFFHENRPQGATV